MFSKVVLPVALLLAGGCGAFAQPSDAVTYVSLRNDNDVYYLPLKTDQYFTNGLRLEVGRRTLLPPAATAPARRLTTYFRLTQDIFTPRAIERTDLMTDDRPFSSYLLLTHGKRLEEAGGWVVHHAWTLGVLGRPSLGGRAQNAFHRMVDFADELPGWQHEVHTDLVVNYRVDLSEQLAYGRRGDLSFGTTARLGTLFTDFGLTGRVGWWVFRSRTSQRGLRVDVNGLTRGVVHNATLSGGLLHTDDRFRGAVRARCLVFRGGVDALLDLGRLELEGGVRWLSPEFSGGYAHAWAYWGVGYGLTGPRPRSRP